MTENICSQYVNKKEPISIINSRTIVGSLIAVVCVALICAVL